MQLAENYRLVELGVTEKDWQTGKQRSEADIHGEGLLVLTVNQANGEFVGVPHGDTRIEVGDTLILYGHLDAIEALDKRRRSMLAEQSHREATLKHEQALDHTSATGITRLKYPLHYNRRVVRKSSAWRAHGDLGPPRVRGTTKPGDERCVYRIRRGALL